jgi:hypothetical protein
MHNIRYGAGGRFCPNQYSGGTVADRFGAAPEALNSSRAAKAKKKFLGDTLENCPATIFMTSLAEAPLPPRL